MNRSNDENRPTDPDITTTGSRLAYENRWMRVREDAIRRRDGSAGIYGVIDKRDFVVIAPVDAGLVHLVQQYRYPLQGAGGNSQGIWDAQPNADPADAARASWLKKPVCSPRRCSMPARCFPPRAP